MKYFKILILSLCFLIGCETDKIDKKTNIVKIDTTYSGNPGKPGYSISISHKIDSILFEWHYRYWEDSKRIEVKDQYMDDKGKLRYIYYKHYPDKNKMRISHSWEDKWGQSIISVDSEYTNNKIKSVEVIVSKEKQIALDKFHTIFEKKYSNGHLKAFIIHDFDRNYWFSEEDDGFWELATDVSPEYAEWIHSTRYSFGKALSDATNYLLIAYSRIDSTYLQIAKDKNNFDLSTFINEGKYKK